MSSPLIAAEDLSALLDSPERPTVLDVRWEVTTGPGRADYLRAHLPGAVFVDLDAELASAPGAGGRHPLPDPDSFVAAMRSAGVRHGRPVVVYDAATSIAAARAWWLLRYFGHEQVRVLDGGFAAWREAGGRLESGEHLPTPGDFIGRPGAMPLVDADGAAALASDGVLLDARAPERFAGEEEPIDPVAGHIPGAVNRPTADNVGPDGRFRPSDALRTEFEALGVSADGETGAYCGSGVAATHEVLALELAGLHSALYIGSWSDWITDPRRPVQTGR